METFTEVTKKVSTVENMSSTLEAFLPMSFNFCGQESWVSVDGGWRNFALYSGKSSCIKLGREHSIIFATLQVWEGQERDCQSVVQAMHAIYDNQGAVAVLFADASNMFDSTNMNVFLPNVALFRYCYSLDNRLLIISGEEIHSVKGVTQGDPTEMVIYALRMYISHSR